LEQLRWGHGPDLGNCRLGKSDQKSDREDYRAVKPESARTIVCPVASL
jgi:hypothetical protein